MELYDGVKISIGPPIEDGFYYDFEFPDGTTVSEADFPKIEERMRAHVKAAEPFVREDVTVAAGARALPGRAPGLQGRADRRPGQRRPRPRRRRRPARDRLAVHERRRSPTSAAARTRRARRAIRRLQAARRSPAPTGAGTRPHDADAHLRHRVLLQGRAGGAPRADRAGARRATTASSGRELGLFRFSEVSPGAAFWLPAGHQRLQRARRRSRGEMGAERGYSEVKTPQIYDSELWKTSGHWGKYRENMFTARGRGPRDGASSR